VRLSHVVHSMANDVQISDHVGANPPDNRMRTVVAFLVAPLTVAIGGPLLVQV
jgi:hypothetical protein